MPSRCLLQSAAYTLCAATLAAAVALSACKPSTVETSRPNFKTYAAGAVDESIGLLTYEPALARPEGDQNAEKAQNLLADGTPGFGIPPAQARRISRHARLVSQKVEGDPAEASSDFTVEHAIQTYFQEFDHVKTLMFFLEAHGYRMEPFTIACPNGVFFPFTDFLNVLRSTIPRGRRVNLIIGSCYGARAIEDVRSAKAELQDAGLEIDILTLTGKDVARSVDLGGKPNADIVGLHDAHTAFLELRDRVTVRRHATSASCTLGCGELSFFRFLSMFGSALTRSSLVATFSTSEEIDDPWDPRWIEDAAAHTNEKVAELAKFLLAQGIAKPTDLAARMDSPIHAVTANVVATRLRENSADPQVWDAAARVLKDGDFLTRISLFHELESQGLFTQWSITVLHSEEFQRLQSDLPADPWNDPTFRSFVLSPNPSLAAAAAADLKKKHPEISWIDILTHVRAEFPKQDYLSGHYMPHYIGDLLANIGLYNMGEFNSGEALDALEALIPNFKRIPWEKTSTFYKFILRSPKNFDDFPFLRRMAAEGLADPGFSNDFIADLEALGKKDPALQKRISTRVLDVLSTADSATRCAALVNVGPRLKEFFVGDTDDFSPARIADVMARINAISIRATIAASLKTVLAYPYSLTAAQTQMLESFDKYFAVFAPTDSLRYDARALLKKPRPSPCDIMAERLLLPVAP